MRVDITIPVLNEERGLEHGVATLHGFIERTYGSMDGFSIVIADNGSVDQTPEIARRLASDFQFVHYIRLEEKGVGRALKASWVPSDADIVGYMDLDMSTDLQHLPEALNAIDKEHADIVYGSRLSRSSDVQGRRLNRAVVSRIFNLIVRTYLGVGISDGMCGFKFLRRSVLEDLMSGGAVSDGWFFSTELIVVAEWRGLRLRELPVSWTDDPDSRVRVVPLALSYVKAMRLLKQKRPDNIPATS